MQYSVVSDLGLHCLLRPVCPCTWGQYHMACPLENIYMNCQILFYGKNEIFFRMLSAKILNQHPKHYSSYSCNNSIVWVFTVFNKSDWSSVGMNISLYMKFHWSWVLIRIAMSSGSIIGK